MNRITWDETYMEMCRTLAKRSTCARIQTASIIVKKNVIVSVGYNGTAADQEHCIEYWKRVHERFSDISFDDFLHSDYFWEHHHQWSNTNEIHGEMNAILFAGRNGIPLEEGTLYTIYSPCIHCAKSILAAGISRVVYSQIYKRDSSGMDFLRERGVTINRN